MSGAERRIGDRHDVALTVLIWTGGGGRHLVGRARNVSRSGIFVQVDHPLPVGRRVDLVIESKVGVIATSGLVVHAVEGQGMGVRFARLSARTEELLCSLLTSLAQRAGS